MSNVSLIKAVVHFKYCFRPILPQFERDKEVVAWLFLFEKQEEMPIHQSEEMDNDYLCGWIM